MSSIIRARNGDMVVSFRWWSAEQSPARRHQQNTPIRHHPDFTTPALGDSRSVQLRSRGPSIAKRGGRPEMSSCVGCEPGDELFAKKYPAGIEREAQTISTFLPEVHTRESPSVGDDGLARCPTTSGIAPLIAS